MLINVYLLYNIDLPSSRIDKLHYNTAPHIYDQGTLQVPNRSHKEYTYLLREPGAVIFFFFPYVLIYLYLSLVLFF